MHGTIDDMLEISRVQALNMARTKQQYADIVQAIAAAAARIETLHRSRDRIGDVREQVETDVRLLAMSRRRPRKQAGWCQPPSRSNPRWLRSCPFRRSAGDFGG
jgi:hypothetical protein